MQLKKIAGKIIIWTITIALILSGAVLSYADEYWDLWDGEISFTLPDGWVCNEIEADNPDDMKCEQVAETYDEAGSSSLSMDLYYARDDVDEYEWIYFRSNKDDAIEYFNKYGKAAVQTLYVENGWQGEVLTGEPELYDADYNTFLVVPVSKATADGQALPEIVYLTCDMTNDGEEVIHKMLRFYNSDGSAIAENQQEDISLIVDEFYDYGYGDDSDYYYDDDDYSSGFYDVFELILGVITIMLPFAVIVIVIVKLARKKSRLPAGGFGNKNRSRQHSKSGWNRTADNPDMQKNVRRDDFSESFGKTRRDDFSAGLWKKHRDDSGSRFRQKSNSSRNESHSSAAERTLHKQKQHPHDHIRPSNAEERYVESLRTLQKSGLLTRDEMQDMLERHERNKMYRR